MLVILITAALLIASSQAQSACDTANTTLYQDDACTTAFGVLAVGGNSTTNPDAVMMVCGGTTCNGNIGAVVNSCPASFLNLIDVFCANNSIAQQACVDVLPDFDTIGALLESVAEACVATDGFLIGQCSANCSQALQDLYVTNGGCCITELLQYLRTTGSISEVFYGLYISALPAQLCSMQVQFCNGVAVPGDPDLCTAAFTSLYGPDDTCSLLIRRVIMDDISAVGLFNQVVDSDCRTRFQAFFNNCAELFDEPPTALIQLIEGAFTLATLQNNGQGCSSSVEDILTMQIQGQVCVRNYFNRVCSEECREAISRLTQQHGCCLNSFTALVTGTSTQLDDQIEYGILAYEIYDLCGIESAGFCSGFVVPATTSAAADCFAAGNQFFAENDLCTNSYRILGELSSSTPIQDAAVSICTSERCRNRLNNYADYLLTCRVGNFLVNVDDDLSYIAFSNYTRHTTCRMRNDSIGCFGLIIFGGVVEINEAFDVTDPSAVCFPIFAGTCTDGCRQLLRQGLDNLGCCIGENTNALVGPDDTVANLCDLPVNVRCAEITPQQANRCTRAQDALLQTASTCGDAFFAFQNAYFGQSDSSANRASIISSNLDIICQRDSCKMAVSEYLEACRDLGENQDNDYDELRQNFDGYACRQSNTRANADCFVLSQTEPSLQNLGAAFFSGICDSLLTTGQCSASCKATLQNAINDVGCCVGEVGAVFFEQVLPDQGVTIEAVAQSCGLSGVTTCAVRIPGTGNGGGGAAMVQGIGLLIILLLGLLVLLND